MAKAKAKAATVKAVKREIEALPEGYPFKVRQEDVNWVEYDPVDWQKNKFTWFRYRAGCDLKDLYTLLDRIVRHTRSTSGLPTEERVEEMISRMEEMHTQAVADIREAYAERVRKASAPKNKKGRTRSAYRKVEDKFAL